MIAPWAKAPMLALVALGCASSSALALSLTLPPGSEQTARDELPAGVQLPIGVSQDGAVPRADFPGLVQREAYFIPSADGTLALTAPLLAELQASGWSILVDCAAAACGGFDFRFALNVLPEPAMHVDLGDFRYLAAKKDDELVAILASRRGAAGYVQVTHASRKADSAAAPSSEGAGDRGGATGSDGVGGGMDGSAAQGGADAGSADRNRTDLGGDAAEGTPDRPSVVITPGAPPPVDAPPTSYTPGQIGAALESLGRVALDDLEFATGSSELGAGSFASLTELAAYLLDHPSRKLALVGHTDATGGLDVNISVSRRRAQSVLEALVRQHKVPRSQLSAEGVGFLAPLRSNLDDAGRTANRRVEAVLLALE